MKCISVLLNNPNLGGKELKNKGELKDFATNLMGFANNDTNLDIVLSDVSFLLQSLECIASFLLYLLLRSSNNTHSLLLFAPSKMYIGGKLLARVQAERRLLAIQRLQHTSNLKNTEREKRNSDGNNDSIAEAPKDGIEGKKDLRSTLQKGGRRRSVLTLQTNEEGKDYVVVEKDVLSLDNKDDVDILEEVTHYSIYAQYVYWHFRLVAVEHFALGKEETRFLPSSETTWDLIREKFSLTSIGLEESLLVYASLHSGLGE